MYVMGDQYLIISEGKDKGFVVIILVFSLFITGL